LKLKSLINGGANLLFKKSNLGQAVVQFLVNINNNQKQVLQKRLKKAKRLNLVFVFQLNLKFLKNEKNTIITPNFRIYLSK